MATLTKNAATTPAAKPAQTAATAETKVSNAKPPMIVPEKTEQQPEVKNALPPIEVRLKKLYQIQRLADRRETLLEAIDNLGGFYVTPDGNGCNLRFSDSKGNVFGIAHPTVIGEMVSLAKSKLNAELEKIESQIDFNLL